MQEGNEVNDEIVTAKPLGEAEKKESTFDKLRQSVSEEDDMPASALTLKTILGGDILYAEVLRKQLWLIVLVVFFTIIYVAFRYQCQQDMIAIDKLETELKDAKYKALSSSSTLTERCRESHVLEILKNNKDSLLKASDQPPYIINVPAKKATPRAAITKIDKKRAFVFLISIKNSFINAFFFTSFTCFLPLMIWRLRRESMEESFHFIQYFLFLRPIRDFSAFKIS